MVKILDNSKETSVTKKLTLFTVKHNNLSISFDTQGNIHIETKGVWEGDNGILAEMMEEVMGMMRGTVDANKQ